jgi:hypothetical protein
VLGIDHDGREEEDLPVAIAVGVRLLEVCCVDPRNLAEDVGQKRCPDESLGDVDEELGEVLVLKNRVELLLRVSAVMNRRPLQR